MIYARIAATGSYLPEKIITNYDFEKRIETSHSWIVERTGIHERHIAAEQESLVDMAEQAAIRAIAAAGVNAQAIDLVIVGTCNGEIPMPSVACTLQKRLGMPMGPAFDVNAACAGFSYALTSANHFIQAGTAKCALVLGVEKISRFLNWEDRSTCVLFGDGAGAVILTASETPGGILSTHLYADGRYGDYLYAEGDPMYIKMNGREVFKVAVTELGRMAVKTLEAHGLTGADIDWLVPHQANLRIIQAVAKRLDMPMEKVIVTVDKHANTSAASVPLALDVAVRDGRIQRGQLLLLESFGAGFAWGSALVRY